jgi:hypothetical protein
MKYTLIDSKGKVMTFYVKAVAELYLTIQGGVLMTEEILNEHMVQSETSEG